MAFPDKMSPEGLAFLKAREALRLTAYLDSAGVWTIGWGHTGTDVHAGQTVTEAEALVLLEVDVEVCTDRMKLALTREPTQHQFDAMACLAFNIGGAAFAKSTVCKQFNAGDEIAAANAFGLWIKYTDPVTKKKLDSPGLIKRRALEKAMFLEGTTVEPTIAAPAAQATTLAESGTVQGGTIATVAGAASGVAAAVNYAQDFLMQQPWIGSTAQFIVAHYPKLAGALAVAMMIAGGYVLWRRYDDRAKGRV